MNTLTHAEWLAARRTGIGGSDIAAIMGVSKWKTPLDVYYEKVEGRQIEENKYMRAGKKLEQVVADYFAEETGALVIPPPQQLYRHEGNELFLASVDRLYENDGTDNILETKTTQKDIIEPEPEWFCQTQWYIGVLWHLGIRGSAIAWLTRGVDFGYRFIEPAPEYIQEMQETAKKFWQDNVLTRIPPEPRTEADIKKLFPSHAPGKIMEADEALLYIYNRLSAAKDNRKGLEKDEAELGEQIKLAMRDAEALVYGGLTICTFKKDKDTAYDPKKFNSRSFNGEAFIKAHPELYKEYFTPATGARKLLMK